jgi:O-antigen ligase
MLVLLNRAPARMRINFVLVVIFLGAVMFFGGASRADVQSLPLVRLAAVVMIAAALMQIDRDQWRDIRLPIFFLLAVAAIIAIQLIPLPPRLWASLPGRSVYMEAMRTAGIDGGWRPLSLTPDLTLNALLAVLPPIAAVFALGLIGRALQSLLVPLLLIAIGLSALIGLLQVTSNTPYFYNITNPDEAVGFFSNRNHFAVLLAIGFPALACWVALPHSDPNRRRTRMWLALCAAAAIFPLLLTTGSRAGLGLGLVGALAALGIRLARRRRDADADRPRFRLAVLLPVGLGVVAIAATILLSRADALSRLLGGAEDQRGAFLPIYLQMARDFFPTGAGFGSFDAVFRAYEPVQSLTNEYMNQAHNDLVQIFIEGGVLAGLALVAFLLWFVARLFGLWRHKVRGPMELMGRTGSVMALLILLSSLVDYPLRTPAMAVLMAVACCWMMARREAPGAEKGEGVGSPGGLS